MSRFRLSETAESELEEILAYIARESGVDRALHVFERFYEAFETLSASPNIGSTRAELTGPTVRWWPVFRYLVLYDPTAKPIVVLRIVHGARDLLRLLGPET